jgi:hypothetical protein
VGHGCVQRERRPDACDRRRSSAGRHRDGHQVSPHTQLAMRDAYSGGVAESAGLLVVGRPGTSAAGTDDGVGHAVCLNDGSGPVSADALCDFGGRRRGCQAVVGAGCVPGSMGRLDGGVGGLFFGRGFRDHDGFFRMRRRRGPGMFRAE